MKRLIQVINFILLFSCIGFFFSTHAFATSLQSQKTKPQSQKTKPPKNSHTITLHTNDDVLLNPGKGWVVYGTPAEQTPQSIAYATVGYTRYDWSEIEPEEGHYNWALIDKDMGAWHKLGKLFAFGVMTANTSNPLLTYITPQWVFDAGATSIKIQTNSGITTRKTFQYIPVWSNPIFLHKVQDFLTALAHRYDGNSSIAYIDIRSYGNWGVQNVDGLPDSLLLTKPELQAHLQMYRNTFKHTRLLIPWGTPFYDSVYVWAVNQHIGLRRDGIMGETTGSEVAVANGKAPAAFEFYDSYQSLVTKGQWSNTKLLSSVNAGKPSYISMGLWFNDAQTILTQQPQLIKTLANKMGYYFILSSATLPITITNRKANTFSLSWKNEGVAYLTQSANVAVALLNTSNNVVQKQWLSKANPQAWTPGKTTVTSASITFTGVPKGKYKLAVGLFLRIKDKNPVYQIGDQGRTNDNWYVLSNSVSVS